MLKSSPHINDLIKRAINQKTALGLLLTKANKLLQANHQLHFILQQLYPNNRKLSQYCYIGKLERNHAIIMTHSASWLTILRFQKNELLKKFRQQEQYASLKSLDITIDPLLQRKKKKIKKKDIKITYLSSSCISLLQQTAKNTNDSYLKKVLAMMANRHKKSFDTLKTDIS